ncbi:MAG TPA: glycogen-binding domain-containing protein [Gemmatimonadaceae bacterium]|nr:glycogen-binding domain-containing protein [Gemmatimonadaceae bacterium]
MNVSRPLVALSLIFLTIPSRATRAQASAAAAIGVAMQHEGDGWRSGTRIDPAFRLDNRWFGLRGDLSAMADANSLRADESSLAFNAASPAIGVLRLTTTSRFDDIPIAHGVMRGLGTVESAISAAANGRGMWLGAAVERSAALDSVAARPLLRLGLWQQWKSMTFSIASETHAVKIGARPATFHTGLRPDSLYDSLSKTWTPTTRQVFFGDSGTAAHALQWADIEARLSGSAARISFDGRLGYRPALDGAAASLWGRVTATAELSPRLSLIAGAGRESARLWVGAPASRFMTLGLRVAPAALMRPASPPHVRPSASTFSIDRMEGGGYVITMRVPDARTVEISGDFNGWKPVALRETKLDVWETALALPAGTYHVNVRVNGDRWVAPPGLASTVDDFNGAVGLLVIR